MQRDDSKNLEYFGSNIQFSAMAIEKFEDGIDKLIEEKGIDFTGVRSAYISISMFAFDKICAQYSRGDCIDDINEVILKYVFYGIKSWDDTSGFEKLYNILSLSVLVGIDNNLLSEIKSKIINNDVHDSIVDNMMNYLDSSWNIENKNAKYSVRYSRLNDVIEGKNSEEKHALLLKYLEVWYELSSDSPWYDSHKSRHDKYNGYWCLEAGAIAKVLKIDDSDLRETKYYPYDLVHFVE